VLLSLLLSGGIGLCADSGNELPHPQRLRTTLVPVETIAITQGEAVRRITLFRLKLVKQQTVRTQTDGLLVQFNQAIASPLEQLLQSLMRISSWQ